MGGGLKEVSGIEQENLLQFAVENGMIDLSTIQAEAEIMERKKLLGLHTTKIWQGKNGKWYTYLDNKLIKRNTKKDLEDVIADHYRTIVETPTFGCMFREWVEKKFEYGEIQRQTYDNYIVEYQSLIEGSSLDSLKLNELTEPKLEDFIKTTIREKSLTAKRWGNMRILISGTVKYAKKHGYTDISMRVFLDELSLSKNMFKSRPKVDAEQVFTREEEQKVKDYIWAREPSLVELGVLLGIETGMRRGEIAVLMPGDIKGDILHVARTEIKYKDENGKTAYGIRESTKGRDGERDIILTEMAKVILNRAMAFNPSGEYVFEKNGTFIKGHSFTKRIQDICKAVGIRPRAMHKLRKTYATNLLNAGVDDKLVEKQMGHTEILTTKQFYYFNNKTLEESKKIIQTALA